MISYKRNWEKKQFSSKTHKKRHFLFFKYILSKKTLEFKKDFAYGRIFRTLGFCNTI